MGIHRVTLAAAALALVVSAAPVTAQTPERSFCFRPGGHTDCRSFILFELRSQLPLVQTDRIVDVRITDLQPDGTYADHFETQRRQELEGSVNWDLGLAVNVNGQWTIGATMGMDLSGNTDRAEGALHFRRWFSDKVAVDVTPGFSRRIDDDDGDQLGYHVATRLHVWDVVLGLRYDAINVPGAVDVYDRIGGGGIITKTDPGGLEHMLSAAVGFESVTGLLVSVIGLVLVASAFSGLT